MLEGPACGPRRSTLASGLLPAQGRARSSATRAGVWHTCEIDVVVHQGATWVLLFTRHECLQRDYTCHEPAQVDEACNCKFMWLPRIMCVFIFASARLHNRPARAPRRRAPTQHRAAFVGPSSNRPAAARRSWPGTRSAAGPRLVSPVADGRAQSPLAHR